MKSIYFLYDLRNYDKSSQIELENSLNELRYEKITPDGLGSGPSTEQIVAWLVIVTRDLSIGIISSLIVEQIHRTLKKLSAWYKSHKTSKNKKHPGIVINLKFENDSKLKSMVFRIDKSISEQQIRIKIQRTKVIEVITLKNSERLD